MDFRPLPPDGGYHVWLSDDRMIAGFLEDREPKSPEVLIEVLVGRNMIDIFEQFEAPGRRKQYARSFRDDLSAVSQGLVLETLRRMRSILTSNAAITNYALAGQMLLRESDPTPEEQDKQFRATLRKSLAWDAASNGKFAQVTDARVDEAMDPENPQPRARAMAFMILNRSVARGEIYGAGELSASGVKEMKRATKH